MRRGTIARVVVAVAVVALIGVLVGVLTGGDEEPKVSGAPREVVATVLVSASVNGRAPVTDRIVLERERGRFRIASAG